ncbi:hypothetical protein [Rhodopirellula sp. MGV]|uniref:hypothetical protein n=1 Tax=Rhodopirellula sp. MGV TaxID=2023130 RepID=UPI000B967A49|nr:hypothetical protein [Rhodopirellula sp. MGV]OYP37956.1 hypothetical protein CGZ80_03795 [Rhodopirellula sp. MGV]PNY34258.1 hypothetical protein C2E31_23760 [Rhodopirellula baltica]
MRRMTSLVLVTAAAMFAGCSPKPTQETPVDEVVEVTTVSTDNEYCPMMGGKVTEDGGTVQWGDKTIGFCCDGCDEEWQALSEEEKQAKFDAAQAKSDAKHDDEHDHEGHDHADHAE